MANQKHSPRTIIQNRVNGVIKSYDSFKTSLKNNRDKITEEDFNRMLEYLEKQSDKKIEELKDIFEQRDDIFKLD